MVVSSVIGSKNLRDSHKILIKAKDEVIAAYRALVSERLESITVEQKDKSFFKKIRDFFRNN